MMSIVEVIEAIKSRVADSSDNKLTQACSSDSIVSFLEQRHGKIPAELSDYLCAVDGGSLAFPLFEDYNRADFIGSVGTGHLLSHSDISDIIKRKFRSNSIYKRVVDMGANHDLDKTVPIIYLGDGATLDYKPLDGKAYYFDEVVADSLSDLLIKQCLMPGFFRDQEDRYLEGDYNFNWVSYKTPAKDALEAFKRCIDESNSIG